MKKAACIPAICLILTVLTATSFAQVSPADFWSETDVDFGEVAIGESKTIDIIVENNGDELLEVTKMNVTGANSQDFTITEGAVPFNIEGGTTHKIVAIFAPKAGAEGLRTVTWEFENTGLTAPNLITLTGTAAAAVVPAKPAEFKTEEDTVNFGEVLIGEQSEMTLEISNPGEEDLVIKNASFAGDNAGEFAIGEGNAPFTITPGMTHVVKFVFTPTDKGERKAEIAFEQENNVQPYIIALKGMCLFNPPVILIESDIVEFNSIKIGQTSERMITIGNSGDEDLNVTAINFVGTNAADFSVKTGNAPFTVKKGETHELVLVFAASLEQLEEAQLQIVSNAGAEPYVLFLSGIGEKVKTDVTGDGNGQTQQTQSRSKDWDEEFRRNVLQGPLTFAHMNGLYALSGYGAMEWTSATPAEHFYTTLSLKFATFNEYNDQEDFDATLTYLEIMGRFGIIENLEAGLKIRLGGWSGTILVPGLPPDSEGSFSLGDIFLSMKYNAIQKDTLQLPMPMEMSGLLTLKLPVGSQDDALGTGGLDIAMNILSTFYFSNDMLAVHAMLGFTYALDGDEIDTESFLWGFLFNWGVGASYIVMDDDDLSIAVLWQLEFYDPNLCTTIGSRADIDFGGTHLMPEIGLTLGLHKLSADMEIYFSFGIPF